MSESNAVDAEFVTREQFLAANDRPEQVVVVPGLGKVLMIGLRADERDEFEAGLSIKKGKKREDNLANLRARLVVKCAHDGKRNRLFTDADAKAVGRKAAIYVDPLFDVGMKLSGLKEDDVGELVEPSKTDQPDDTPSDSPDV